MGLGGETVLNLIGRLHRLFSGHSREWSISEETAIINRNQFDCSDTANRTEAPKGPDILPRALQDKDDDGASMESNSIERIVSIYHLHWSLGQCNTRGGKGLDKWKLESLESRRINLCKKLAVNWMTFVRKKIQLNDKSHIMNTRTNAEYNVHFAYTKKNLQFLTYKDF